MKINIDFKDIIIVNEDCAIEYFNIGNLNFFDLKPEELIGKKPYKLYFNLAAEDSTLMKAIKYSVSTAGLTQTLITRKHKTVRQVSDTFCIKNGEKVIGAVEFAYYDESKDILKSAKEKRKSKDPSMSLNDIIGDSPEMTELKHNINKIIDLESSVLLTGDTGTGKEMTVRVIHSLSKRSSNPFIYVNCNALPETLLEGLLFGTKKGSFTDSEDKIGLFQMADQGTIFLDEIDSIPLRIQGKLLKVIEDKCIRPIGESKEIYLDVRIIASCNISAEQLMKEKKLRSDLYFRLSVIQFHLPPLRERGDDIILIAEYYIGKFNKEYKKNIIGISGEVKSGFLKYSWPGNVRELRNMLEGIYPMLDRNIIEIDDVKDRIRIKNNHEYIKEWELFKKNNINLKSFLENNEKEQIEKVLIDSGNDIGLFAQKLEISRQLAINKLIKYKIKYFT